jgi:hypothetical protein
MGQRTKLGRRIVGFLAIGLLSGLGSIACGGKDKPPPPPPEKLGPEERILSVGKAWREMTQTEGFVNQPDVAFIRVTDQFTLHLKPGSRTALVDIDRNELIRAPDGREFHCKVEGAVRSSVKYAWRMEEASVSLYMPGASLPRKCRERGFTRAFKQFPGLTATYALRGDQLIAIDPVTLRSSLLPAD